MPSCWKEPTKGARVVKGCGEVFGLVLVRAAMSEDFPALGRPTRATWKPSFLIPFLEEPDFFGAVLSFLSFVRSCLRRFSEPL